MHWLSVVAGGGQGRVRLLLPGRRGARVRQLQEKLLEAGFDPGPIDGIYGLLTGAAVQELQRAFGLREDGLAGPEVWSVLSDPEALALRPLVRLQPSERLETVAARWRIDPAVLRSFNDLPPATAPAAGDLVRLLATYRLAWPRPLTRSGPGHTSGWSRTLLAASIPHLSGLVAYVLTLKTPAVPPDQTQSVNGDSPHPSTPFVSAEMASFSDLPEQAGSAGCDRWALLPAQNAHDLALALSLGDEESRTQIKQVPRSGRSAARRNLVVVDPRLGDVDGILVDAGGFRLPAQLPELLALLGELRRLSGGQGAKRSRLEVVLPAVPAAGKSFWRTFGQVCARLAGRVDRLWLSGFRRPEDWSVAGRPLHLTELERMLRIARETWMPWRLGLVLPAGGWWSDGRPLGRQETLALRRRDRMRLGLAGRAGLAGAAAGGTRDPGRRDDASGLVMLGWVPAANSAARAGSEAAGQADGDPGQGEAAAAPEAYLVDQDTWRMILRLAQQAGVGGLAVHPWGEEHPSLWEVFPEFSGRLGEDKEASPGTGGI